MVNRLFLFILLSLLLNSAFAIDVVAVGDVQMGRAWPEEKVRLPPSADVIFAKVESHFVGDIVFANVETVISDEGESRKCRKGKNCFAFRVPSVYAETLSQVGFNLVSSHNNHAMDFSEKGAFDTVDHLMSNGIMAADRDALAVREVDGKTIALLAFSTGNYGNRVQDVEVAQRKIRFAKSIYDYVFVSFHGGAEGRTANRVLGEEETYYGENRGDVKLFSRSAIEAGADLVLGHGPHVLRAIEIYKGKLIAYSLGNFTAWETFKLDGTLGLSGILKIRLDENGDALKAEFVPVKIDWPGIPRIDESKESLHLINKLSRQDFGVPLFSAEDGVWVRHD